MGEKDIAQRPSTLGKIGLTGAALGWVGMALFTVLPRRDTPLRTIVVALWLCGGVTGLVMSVMGLYVDERKKYAIVGTILAGMIFLLVGWAMVQMWQD